MATTYDSTTGGRTLLGHPVGLFVLFFAEMWERFSYYGMRALLIFYLTQHWLFSDGRANLIYGAYTSLVYITPLLGGYLADRYLGQRKATQFGAVLLAVGHCLMAVEGSGGQQSAAINVFWLALSFIIVGSGFLKANISVIVGDLYPLTDVRRDGAYTIFYVGVNTGAALGTLVAGYLGQTYGWSYGFGAAGIGMILGLIVFVVGRPTLMGKGEPGDPALLRKRVAGIPLEGLLYLIGTLSVGVIWALIQFQDLIGGFLLIAAAVLLGYMLYVALTKLDRDSRDRMFVILFLLVLQPVFWGFYEQAGGSLNLFTSYYVAGVQRPEGGPGIAASLFQSINPIYIVLLGPLFAMLWTFLGRKGLEPSTPAKFGLGLVQLGLGFLALVFGAHAAGIDVPTPVIWIFVIYLLHTTGELCLSPVGVSAMNRLAPMQMGGLIMGAWFFATAGGQFVAGKIGEATGAIGSGASQAAKELTLSIYTSIGWISIGVGVAVMVVAPFMKRLMHLDTLTDRPDRAMLGQAELAEPAAAGIDTRGEVKPV